MSCICKVSVLNPENMAITEYTNYSFNSLVFFNGKYFGFTDTGIFELTGVTDDGVAIPEGEVKTGTVNLDIPRVKRLISAWLVARKQGEVELSVTVDENEVYSYRSELVSEKLEEERIKVGRGIKATVYSFGLKNTGNQPCEVDSLRVMAQPIDRGR